MNREHQINEEIKHLRVEQELIRSRKTLKCPKCEKRTALSKWTLIKDHYYVPPRGCIDGDYWTFTEYKIYCPKCEDFSRVFNSDYLDMSKLFGYIKEYSRYFGETLGMWGKRYHGTIDHIREMNKG